MRTALHTLLAVSSPFSSQSVQWGEHPYLVLGVIVFLYKLSGCITEAMTQCLPCSHHSAYWASTKLAAKAASFAVLIPVLLMSRSWNYLRCNQEFRDILKSPHFSREVKLKERGEIWKRTSVKWLDHDRVGVMSSCVAAQTWQIGEAFRWQTDSLNSRTGRCARRQTNRKAARKKKTKRHSERKMNQDQQKGRDWKSRYSRW